MKTILVIEDNEDMQEIYKDLLGEYYRLIIVSNTADAEVELESNKIDLVILDIVLPGESGDTFLERIKEKQKYQDIAVIAITVLGDLSDHLNIIHPKIICIPKPFEKNELMGCISKMAAKG